MEKNLYLDKIKIEQERLINIQNNDKTGPLVIFFHDPTGLGAQISRRLLALKIACAKGVMVNFPNETMYPYDVCYEALAEKGKFLSETEINNAKKINISKFNYSNQGEIIYRFAYWDFSSSNADKELIEKYYEKLSNNSYGNELIFDGMLISFMKLKPEYENYVKEQYEKLIGVGDYLSIHYRRGDKKVEAPYVSCNKYVESILRLSKATGVRRIFLASDSADAKKELELEKYGLEVIFDENERRFNNANHKFLMKNSSLAKQETMTAIKNIYLLSRGMRIVGQDNAHFATIAASIIAFRNGHENFGELIPGTLDVQNKAMRLYYKLKGFIKALVKTLAPGLVNVNEKNK